MRFPKFLGRSVLLASILGAVFPIFFSLLFSWNISGTHRDILPAFDNPLAFIGCGGMVIFALPVFIIAALFRGLLNAIHTHGLVIPLYDSLPPNLQSDVFLAVSIIMNVLLWTILFVSLTQDPKTSKTDDAKD